MKPQSIVVEQLYSVIDQKEEFLVIQAKNTLYPKVSQLLTTQEMEDIMATGELDVTIKPRSR